MAGLSVSARACSCSCTCRGVPHRYVRFLSSVERKSKKWMFLQSNSGLTGLMSSLLLSTMDAEKKLFNKLSFN